MNDKLNSGGRKEEVRKEKQFAASLPLWVLDNTTPVAFPFVPHLVARRMASPISPVRSESVVQSQQSSQLNKPSLPSFVRPFSAEEESSCSQQ